LFPGGNATLHVLATGSEPLFYQWHRDGEPIAGATESSLALTNLLASQSGHYTVVVFNDAGFARSEPAMLTVIVVATIVTQPKDVLVRIRPDPQAAATTNATFAVLASGSTALRYQWRLNGRDLPGATRTSLTITNVQAADAGDFDVIITGAAGQVVSAVAHLYPLATPIISQAPVSQSIVAGGTVTLSLVFSGSPAPFTNEWRRGSTLVETHVLNEGSDFFTVTVPNVATSLQYRAFVKNLAAPGGGVISSFATITVQADADTNGLPDVWETAYGVHDANADPDGDGLITGQEYQAGTSPTNALSYLKIEIHETASQATVQFGAISNLTYTLQYRSALGEGVWTRLADMPARRTNHVETITLTNTASAGFYRVVTPRQP
jgi:hypothetical protein